ncbi:uncharacterized protein [Euwallacea fornicatus]|uniref:uncharacterized protein n=1 Tax=Euwallacea fornicatus TaxID=995702 RepID=UPI00338D51C0
MSLESDLILKPDQEDEDVGCFFLQPTSSPYNITEKVQQANFFLFNSTPQTSRSTKVKFRDELVSFEPDLTDDDVNSIESDDHVDDFPSSNDPHQVIKLDQDNVPYNTILRGEVDIFDIEEEIDEAIVEELILSDENFTENECPNETKKPILSPKANELNIKKCTNSNSGGSKKYCKRRRRPHRELRQQQVRCKEHCIEKLDAHLLMSIKKLEIHEKPPLNLPPLQLHQRKCCDDIKLANSDRNLPHYNGSRSEYGLSSRQIKNRDRYTEMIRQKEIARRKLIEDYRALKVQQNEQVFCQWLREVSKRNKERIQGVKHSGISSRFRDLSYGNNSNFTDKGMVKYENKGRPKTAGFVPKTKKKKRPHSSQSCVYIELSPNLLNKGVHIGDLLITNSKELSKKFHILTIS